MNLRTADLESKSNKCEFTEILAAEEGLAIWRVLNNEEKQHDYNMPVYDYKNLPGISQLVSIKGSGSDFEFLIKT